MKKHDFGRKNTILREKNEKFEKKKRKKPVWVGAQGWGWADLVRKKGVKFEKKKVSPFDPGTIAKWSWGPGESF